MRSKKDLQFARCTFFGDAGRYGVAPISKLPKIIRLFCKRALQKRLFSAKDTHNFKEPSNRSHPISPTRYIFSKSQLTTTSATQVHMGWLWLAGSIKLHVSFAENRLFYRALLQKKPIILSILLTEATP